MLDTASNGNFLNQDVDDGWQLVENIANSNGSYGEEYDRTNRSSTHHSIESDEKLRKDVKSLNEKLDKLILAQSTMKKVNFVSAEEMEPVQEGEDTQFAEVCYMSNGQGGPGYPQQQQARSSQAHNMGMVLKTTTKALKGLFLVSKCTYPPGFPHQPPQPAPTPEHELKAMLKQLLQGKLMVLWTQARSWLKSTPRLRISTQECTLWRIMLLLLLLLQSKDNYLVKPFRTPRNSARSSSLKKAPGVQIDQPEVQATTVAFHTSPVELAQQARSAARSSRTLARSSQTSSVLKPILLDPYQPVDPSSGRLLSQSHKEVIHKFRRDLVRLELSCLLWKA
ncbi:unnamed protein product [Microthlaspi erraticum]|uniref:Uncharacterized protein n=1 Tax=Microthlaspi erraticum TaxID=1685480 RepID=A0A6D2K6C5_9BRAS|nr:unnamed protein product [Microthlaspi erraticum]